MTPARTVRLLPEIDSKLVRYAELRGLSPAAVIATAAEDYLRSQAELALRIADARRAYERAGGTPGVVPLPTLLADPKDRYTPPAPKRRRA